MGIGEKFKRVRKFIGSRKKPETEYFGEDGGHIYIIEDNDNYENDDDDEITEKTKEAEGTKENEKTEGKEIVVSLKKLKEYIKRKFSGFSKEDLKEIVDSKSSHDIKLKIVEFFNKEIDELKKQGNVEALVLLFSLISCYFRNDSSKTITEVKFSEKK